MRFTSILVLAACLPETLPPHRVLDGAEPDEPVVSVDPAVEILNVAPSPCEGADLGPSVAVGGDLFVNSCRPVGDSLVCSPWRMTVFPGAHPCTVTTALPEVVQPLNHDRALLDGIALPGLVGSTVDRKRRLVYWHADCDAGYHVTHLDDGQTDTFAIDLHALGLEDDGHGLCLGEWVYDEAADVAIALAGRQDRDGGIASEKSSVELALAVDATGGVEILQDLRGKIDPQFRFLHEFQTIASLDPERDEVVAPLFHEGTGEENQLLLDLGTGRVTLPGAGSGRQHRFFDVAAREQTAFDCAIPGFTSALAELDPDPRFRIAAADLTSVGITDICGGGFAGGGYDPIGGQELLLMRTTEIAPHGVFLLGVADLLGDRWLGAFRTDATYEALGFAGIGDGRLFLATELAPPAPDDAPSGVLGPDEERRFATAKLPSGDYAVAITGTGDADLYVRKNAEPTTTTFDCRPFLVGSDETCHLHLANDGVLQVLVRGFGGTSTFRLTATDE